ncbi:MAG: lysophospholipid acyltransferase family protein [Gammaproteobacteria bacterium]|nr:lysophospholipid acyltransferase family protein [Gammaproteobacteria bacterium]
MISKWFENVWIKTLAIMLKVCIPFRWKVTCHNLQRLYPEKEAKAIAWQSYLHHARLLAYVPRLKQVVHSKKIRMNDPEHFEAMLKAPAVFMFSGHVGLWELVPFILNKYGLENQHWLYKQSRIKSLDRLLFRFRQSPGLHTWDSLTQLKDALKGFKQHGHLGLASDQGAGYQSNFFGMPMKFPIGSQKLVARYQVPCYFFSCMFENDELVIHTKPLPLNNVQDAYISELEQVIKQYPEQYYWMHRLWQV